MSMFLADCLICVFVALSFVLLPHLNFSLGNRDSRYQSSFDRSLTNFNDNLDKSNDTKS